jgi:hemolysin III
VTAARRRFSIARFAILVVLQLSLLFLLISLIFPRLWARQLAAGWPAFVLVFLGMHLFLSFFEWFFHRYVLHSITMWWLERFASGHRHHHSLTAIRLRPADERSDRFVLNEYPILVEEQYPDSDFPAYALGTFWLLFTPLLIVVQLIAPRWPIMLAGYAAITWSMSLYEILHAIDHWPYEWWKRATEHPRFGAFWRLLYGFHLMHHANVGCNEAISGFFGLPIPDWCFGTYHQPKELLLEGRLATARDFAIPRPRAIVRWVDRWARRRETDIFHSRPE